MRTELVGGGPMHLGAKFLEYHEGVVEILAVLTEEVEFTHRCLVAPFRGKGFEGLDNEDHTVLSMTFRAASNELLLRDFDQLRVEMTCFALKYWQFGGRDAVVTSTLRALISHRG